MDGTVKVKLIDFGEERTVALERYQAEFHVFVARFNLIIQILRSSIVRTQNVTRIFSVCFASSQLARYGLKNP